MNYSIEIYQNDEISDVCENFLFRTISQDNGIWKCEVHSNNRKTIFFFSFFSFGEDLYFVGLFFLIDWLIGILRAFVSKLFKKKKFVDTTIMEN